MANKQQRSKNFGIILYPDNADHVKVMDHVRTYAPVMEWTHFSILHDKDKFEDERLEEEKKPHYHLVVIGETTRTTGSMAERLTLPSDYGFIQPINSNPRGMLRYLTHLDHPEKYQYSASDVVGNEDYTTYLNGLSRTRNSDDSRRVFMTVARSFTYMPTWIEFMDALEDKGLGDWARKNFLYVKQMWSSLMFADCGTNLTKEQKLEREYREKVAKANKKVIEHVERQMEEARAKYIVMEATQGSFELLAEGVKTPFEEERT